MSKHELLSWTSLASSATVLFFYVLIFFGMPDFLEKNEDQLVTFFVNTFWVVLAVELLIGLSEHRQKVDKDERDYSVEAKGHKFAYTFLLVILILMLSQVMIGPLMSSFQPGYQELYSLTTLRHALFLTILSASVIKRITMVVNYRIFAG